MPSVVPAEGTVLERILDTTYPVWHEGLTRQAFSQFESAQTKIAWALRHQRRFALVDRTEVLASARRYDLAGKLEHQGVRICGIGAVFTDPAHGDDSHAPALVEWLLDDARREGADLALLFATTDRGSWVPHGFEVVPTTDIELTVTESTRHGAPMTLVRGGEERDLGTIAAMGQVRADRCRFHLARNVDYVKYAITRKRLLAGLAADGFRQLQFVVAEEGITAAAYVVISIVDRTWTIEECGDRDPSGARVGAILQALIAQQPVERRPVVRGWLPPDFVPPQVTIVSVKPSAEVMFARVLAPTALSLRLSSADVLYWRSDMF